MPQSKIFSPNKTLNFSGRLVDLNRPRVMGIINTTPDSFYYGSRISPNQVVDVVEDMLQDGADFLDVGGYSSRPGAADVPVEEELKRTVPVIQSIKKNFPHAIVSIDTFRSEVARQCIDAGVDWVNDISAGSLDEKMFSTVAQGKIPYIMMHMRGTPQTMKHQTDYGNLLHEIVHYLQHTIQAARSAGIQDIVIDPGFGFAKTAQQSFYVLRHLSQLNVLELPILAGISRKSMIWNTLQIAPDEALNGTTALHMVALMQGASILRVHDVRQAKECIKLYEQIQLE